MPWGEQLKSSNLASSFARRYLLCVSYIAEITQDGPTSKPLYTELLLRLYRERAVPS